MVTAARWEDYYCGVAKLVEDGDFYEIEASDDVAPLAPVPSPNPHNGIYAGLFPVPPAADSDDDGDEPEMILEHAQGAALGAAHTDGYPAAVQAPGLADDEDDL